MLTKQRIFWFQCYDIQLQQQLEIPKPCHKTGNIRLDSKEETVVIWKDKAITNWKKYEQAEKIEDWFSYASTHYKHDTAFYIEKA